MTANNGTAIVISGGADGPNVQPDLGGALAADKAAAEQAAADKAAVDEALRAAEEAWIDDDQKAADRKRVSADQDVNTIGNRLYRFFHPKSTRSSDEDEGFEDEGFDFEGRRKPQSFFGRIHTRVAGIFEGCSF